MRQRLADLQPYRVAAMLVYFVDECLLNFGTLGEVEGGEGERVGGGIEAGDEEHVQLRDDLVKR